MRIELLNDKHDTAGFSCSEPALDEWFCRHALENQRNASCRTFVATEGERVAGFYGLAAGSVRPEVAPLRIARGLARHAIPVAVLARLAVATSHQGQGLGTQLFRNALIRTFEASEILGVRALLIHAKHDAAREWYCERFGVEQSPVDPLQLFLLMKDIRAALSAR